MFGHERTHADLADTAAGNAEFQDLVTRYCFGTLWSRDVISRKVRSMITIGLLTSLNRTPHLKIHIRAALTNGVTQEEIVEVMLHAAQYCGVPASGTGLETAREVFAEQAELIRSGGDAEARPGS
jgi:alkylhydroperoxidase/carboxymuconolactone decarboxylase family protein YurZ